MKQYLLSVCYPADGSQPPPAVLNKISSDVVALQREMQSAGVWVFTGGHAATCRACDPASRRSDIWLGARSSGEDSFPLTEVPHLDPAMSMFRAELTSRSCDSPQFTQTHCLTARCLRPLGPVRARQLEHARVVFFSLTT